MHMDYKKEFFQNIKSIFVPTIKSFGFNGTGNNYYRKIGHTIQTLNIQGNKYGGSSCVNLGLHFDYLPVNNSLEIKPEKIFKTYYSTFSKRLAPHGQSDYWWQYKGKFPFGNSKKSVIHLNETFLSEGMKLFEKFESDDDVLPHLRLELIQQREYIPFFGGITAQRAALTVSRIYAQKHALDKALLFAQEGLKISENAPILVKEFEMLIKELSNAHGT